MQLSKITATMMALSLFGAGIGQSATVIAAPLANFSVNAATPDTKSAHSAFVQVSEQKRAGHKLKNATINDKTKNTNVNNKTKNTNVNNKTKNTNVNNKTKNTNVNNKTKNTNINNTTVNRNVNVTVIKRPSGWHGQYWGRAVFGITLGTVIIVAANTPPPPPDPTLCWTWSNSALTEGFWYYCSGN